MTPYDSVRRYVDFGNHYTIQKALNVLRAEFDKALKTNNTAQAKLVQTIVQRLYDEFSTAYVEGHGAGETMSYVQKQMAGKMRAFVVWMDLQLNKPKAQQIKQIIDGGAKNEPNI